MSRAEQTPPDDHRADDHSAHNGAAISLAELMQDEDAAAGVLTDLRQAIADGGGAPDDVQQLLDGPGSATEILQRLVEAGVVAAPQEGLADVLAGFEPLLEPEVEPIEAELCGYDFLAMVRADLTDQADLPDLLSSLAADAEQHGGPAALAMLRVLAAVAPAPAASVAGAAADRLVATGLTDCQWASQLGAPKVGDCFSYAHGSSQDAFAATFWYGEHRHLLAVFIDHDQGGGVQDLWVTDQPDQTRSVYEEAAEELGVPLREHEPSEAAQILERALQQQPCPVEPDQVEDVGIHLDLLRQRVQLLKDEPAAAR